MILLVRLMKKILMSNIHRQRQRNFICFLIFRALIHVGKKASLLDKAKETLKQSVICRTVSRLERSFYQSNNIFVFLLRSLVDGLKDRFSGVFRENEPARAIIAFRTIDHSFTTDGFLRECREFIIPEVIESFLNNDLVRLKMWTSEGTFNLLKANLNAMKRPNCILDGQLFDLRNVDIHALKMLDDKPVIIVRFQTQQIMVIRDEKTGELVDGDEEKLERYEYGCAFTKNEFIQSNGASDETNGWRIIDLDTRKV